MHIRPGFFKAHSFRPRNSTHNPDAMCGDDATMPAPGTGVEKVAKEGVTVGEAHPRLDPHRVSLPHTRSRGRSRSISSWHEARTHSHTTSVASSRGSSSPSSTEAFLADIESSSSLDPTSCRAGRATSDPADGAAHGGRHHGRTLKAASRWRRLRGGGGDDRRAVTQVVVVTAVDLADEGLGVLDQGWPRGLRAVSDGGRGSGSGSGFDPTDIDWDDEELMERKRGDGNGVSDEEEEGEEDGTGCTLGEPAEGSWESNAYLVGDDPSGAMRLGFFSDSAPTRESGRRHKPRRSDAEATVACEGGCGGDESADGNEVSFEATEGIPGMTTAAEVSPAGPRPRDRDRRHSRGRDVGTDRPAPTEEEPSPVAERLASPRDDQVPRGGVRQRRAELPLSTRKAEEAAAAAVEDNSNWWSLGRTEKDDGIRWWLPMSESQEKDDDDDSGWWSALKSDVREASAEGLLSGASSLLTQAALTFSVSIPGADPPAPALQTAAITPPAGEESEQTPYPTGRIILTPDADGARADGGASALGGRLALRGKTEGGGNGGGGGGGGQSSGSDRGDTRDEVKKQFHLLNSMFFCRVNGMEDMKEVLMNKDLRLAFREFLEKRWCAENLDFVEDVMRYQEAVARQRDGADVKEGEISALSLGSAIKDTFLVECSSKEVNIGDGMRSASLNQFAKDVEAGVASMDTFTPIALELVSLLAHASLREFRASAHYATIEACMNLGPRGVRNSGATSSVTVYDEEPLSSDEE